MFKEILAAGGCLAAIVLLWLGLLALELYWNLFAWNPALDLKSSGIILWVLLSLALARFCLGFSFHRFLRFLTLIFVLGIFAAGIYACRPEPITKGLFGRNQPSPFLYRSLRVLLTSIPLWFWVLNAIKRGRALAKTGNTELPALSG